MAETTGRGSVEVQGILAPLTIDPDHATVWIDWTTGSENERSVFRDRELRRGLPSCRDAGLDGYGSSGESKRVSVEGRERGDVGMVELGKQTRFSLEAIETFLARWLGGWGEL